MKHPPRSSSLVPLLATLLAPLSALGCDDASTGTLRVLVDAEDSIVSGVSAGASDEDITDGWDVRFDRYVLVLGGVDVARADGSERMTSDAFVALDLTAAAASGSELLVLSDLPDGSWGRFGFESRPADADTLCDESVSSADCAAMRAEGLSHLISGAITKVDGESCPPSGACRDVGEIAFELRVGLHVRYVECETEGSLEPGFSVPSGGATAVSVTIHGDHPFFNGFPEGVEVVERRAQWLADADTNADDLVDLAELRAITGADLAALLPASEYNFSGGPTTVDSAGDWLEGQLATQGHMNGEGECITTLLSVTP